MTERRILLVRHGRSTHVHTGWIDVAGFNRWRAAYEAAGIDDAPPQQLRDFIANTGIVVCSDARRAIESARALAPQQEPQVSTLLRELDLAPPNLGTIRLPLAGWALAYGVRMLVRAHRHVTPAEHERALEAAQWLASLTEQHDTVIAVTHHAFRHTLARTLQTLGWKFAPRRRNSSHWSAWILTQLQ